jgi:hypothetical protein
MHIANFIHMKTTRVPTEYNIYAYHKYCEDAIGYNKWQCLSNGKNSLEVLSEAERLFKSKKFEKIEIKKIVFDQKNNRYLASTFHVLDNHSKKNIFVISAMVLLSFLCGGLFILELL